MLNLVVATDLSDRSALAIRRAARLAQSLPARLTVLHVNASAHPRSMDHAAAALDQSLACLNLGDLDVKQSVAYGGAHDRIIQFARAADLLILGEPRRQPLRQFFIGTTAHRILKRVTTPALVVRTPATHAYQRTLFAVDFSPVSHRILGTALALGFADHCNAVAHVYDSAQIHLMIQAGSYSLAGIKAQIRRQTTQIEGRLKALMDESGLRGRAAALLEKTSPADSILVFAKAFRADLIVAGSRVRPPITRVALGSVAESILVNAPCDLLLVPPGPAPAEPHRDGSRC